MLKMILSKYKMASDMDSGRVRKCLINNFIIINTNNNWSVAVAAAAAAIKAIVFNFCARNNIVIVSNWVHGRKNTRE